jgi:hypothetical protein
MRLLKLSARSFGSLHLVCNRGLLVPPEPLARDDFDGAAYLRSALEVRAQQVGVIGFSYGGWAVC